MHDAVNEKRVGLKNVKALFKVSKSHEDNIAMLKQSIRHNVLFGC